MRTDFARLMRRGSGGYEDVHVRRTIIDDDGVRVRARDIRKGWTNHRAWNSNLVRRFLAARVGKSRAAIESEIAATVRTRPERRAFDRIMSSMMVDPDYRSSYRCFSFDKQNRLVMHALTKADMALDRAVRNVNPERIELTNGCALVLVDGGWVREKISELGLLTKRRPLTRREWLALDLERYRANALLMKQKHAAGANVTAYIQIHNEIVDTLVPRLAEMGYRLTNFVR